MRIGRVGASHQARSRRGHGKPDELECLAAGSWCRYARKGWRGRAAAKGDGVRGGATVNAVDALNVRYGDKVREAAI